MLYARGLLSLAAAADEGASNAFLFLAYIGDSRFSRAALCIRF